MSITLDGTSGITTPDINYTTPFPVSDGGTGLSSITAGHILVGAGTANLTTLAPGAAGNTIVSTGTSWQSTAVPALTATSGSAPYYGARAWVNFQGSNGTRLANGNISGVTRLSAGTYTILFSTALPDANYVVVVSGSYANDSTSFNFGVSTYNPSTTGFNLATFGPDGLNADWSRVHVVVYR